MSNNPFGPANSGFSTTNNPFVLASDPNDPSNRFPKLDGNGAIQANPLSPQSYQGQQAYPAQSFNGQYPQQQQAYLPQQQQQNPYLTAQPTGVGFQASSSFGQQLEAHYGPGPLQAAHTGIGARVQTSSPLYQNVADLDPYASLAQLPWAQPASQTQQQQTPASSTSSSFGSPSSHEDHPRSFVRTHKQELEKWDAQSWKQFQNSVTKLKDAWILRKNVVIKATELYNKQWTPEDANRCQTLLQEADSNIDTIAASEFQLKEVESGYRHSSDAASKSRVREALNAGLRALPEWPEELQTSTGVTVAYANPGQYGYQQQPQQPQLQSQPQQYQQVQQQQQQQQFQQQQYPQRMFQLTPQPTGYGAQQIYPQYTGWQQPQQFTGFR